MSNDNDFRIEVFMMSSTLCGLGDIYIAARHGLAGK
jgi:hypothetical protein